MIQDRPALLDRIAKFLVHLGGAALIVMACVITVEALFRKYVGITIGGVDEITKYVFAISSAFAFGWAVIERINVRISVLRDALPPRGRASADILAWAALTLVLGMIGERAVALAWESWEDGARSVTVLRVPLVWPQALWAFGICFACFASLCMGWRALRAGNTAPIAPANDDDAQLRAALVREESA